MSERGVVVADSSPLISLSSIGQLELLRLLFRYVTVPPAVWTEVVGTGAPRRPGADDVATAQWIIRADAPPLDATVAGLGAGEAEAIVLARSIERALLLVDDAAARRRAHTFGIDYMGTVGVLRLAKVRGHVGALQPIVESLLAHGFRLDDAVVERLLREVGEG